MVYPAVNIYIYIYIYTYIYIYMHTHTHTHTHTIPTPIYWGTRWRTWLRHCATSRKVAGSIPNGHWNFSSFRPHYGPGVDSASDRKEYQEYFLRGGGKGGRCVGLTTLPHPCADCHEIWEPQPPGTLRASPDMYRDCFSLLHLFIKIHTQLHVSAVLRMCATV